MTMSGTTAVLVIDDDEFLRFAIVEQLHAAGCTTYELPSAIGATQLIQKHNIQVVVVDILMPTMRGDKLAQVLRKNPRLAHVGVILISGGGDSVRLDALGAEVGADAVLEKGNLMDLAELVQQVRRAVEKRQRI
jgi:CheY-like chemotaxis protein